MAKEYELVGGQPVKISPLEVSEDGTYSAPSGRAYNPVIVSGSGGGSSLPPVTSDDNGDFLGVVGGEWGKVGGYSVSGGTVVLIPEQSVTTADEYGQYWGYPTATGECPADGELVNVSFNGVEYEIIARTNIYGTGDFYLGKYTADEYGSLIPDFAAYPFMILIDTNSFSASVITETATTATIKVELKRTTVKASGDFIDAINHSMGEVVVCPRQTVVQTAETQNDITLTQAQTTEAQQIIRELNDYNLIGQTTIANLCASVNGIIFEGTIRQGLYKEKDGIVYQIAVNTGNNDGKASITFGAYDANDNSYVAGEYEVEIICKPQAPLIVYFYGAPALMATATFNDITSAYFTGRRIIGIAEDGGGGFIYACHIRPMSNGSASTYDACDSVEFEFNTFAPDADQGVIAIQHFGYAVNINDEVEVSNNTNRYFVAISE